MITPDEIVAKAEVAYQDKFLPAWICGEAENLFPLRIRANLKRDRGNLSAAIKSVEQLRGKSKQTRGWGYTLHWKQVRSRDIGSNREPDYITIDTQADLLRLARREKEFSATEYVADQIRQGLPQLEDWLVSHVRTVAAYEASIGGLIAVTQHFLDNPWPNCFARQFPVAVHTKFVEQHSSVLRQWLEIVLPASAIDFNEHQFAHRFGLRDKQRHRGIRILETAMMPELGLPFDELSLPQRSLAMLPVRDATVFIVENHHILLYSLPPVTRGLGIQGEGHAVTRLESLKWLHDNRLIYWGDVDITGFQILSNLRNLFPHAESILMDRHTLEANRAYVVHHETKHGDAPSNLTAEETATFQICAEQQSAAGTRTHSARSGGRRDRRTPEREVTRGTTYRLRQPARRSGFRYRHVGFLPRARRCLGRFSLGVLILRSTAITDLATGCLGSSGLSTRTNRT